MPGLNAAPTRHGRAGGHPRLTFLTVKIRPRIAR
jgi:hypothetical protein